MTDLPSLNIAGPGEADYIVAVGDFVYDSLTCKPARITHIKLDQNCVGVGLDTEWLGGGRHPWEISQPFKLGAEDITARLVKHIAQHTRDSLVDNDGACLVLQAIIDFTTQELSRYLINSKVKFVALDEPFTDGNNVTHDMKVGPCNCGTWHHGETLA